MDDNAILAATGGLPPSAFTLSAQESLNSHITGDLWTSDDEFQVADADEDSLDSILSGTFSVYSAPTTEFSDGQVLCQTDALHDHLHAGLKLFDDGRAEDLSLPPDTADAFCANPTLGHLGIEHDIERLDLPGSDRPSSHDQSILPTSSLLSRVASRLTGLKGPSHARRIPNATPEHPARKTHKATAPKAAKKAEATEGTTRAKISSKAKQFLEERFRLEIYPDASELGGMAWETGLNIKSVRDWFNNKRRRMKPEEIATLQRNQSERSLPLTEESLEELQESLSPDDTVSVEKYKRSIVSFGSRASIYSQGSASSVTSRFSKISKNSYRLAHRKARQGRRLWDSTQKSEGLHDSNTFHCTFCWKSFPSRYPWKRHEEDQHTHPIAWICRGQSDAQRKCLYCHHCSQRADSCPVGICLRAADDPQIHAALVEEHLQQHRHGECRARNGAEIHFTRKNHLLQHLRDFHQVNDPSNLIANTAFNWWDRRAIDSKDPALGCPFCTERCNTWESRVSHVAWHFRDIKRLPRKLGSTILQKAADRQRSESGGNVIPDRECVECGELCRFVAVELDFKCLTCVIAMNC